MPFIVAISVQLACQLFKFIIYSIRDKKVSPKYFVTTGGMPSAHSAFVTSLTVFIGLSYGVQGPWFSVSLVLAIIVMYDAYRLRGFVQQHAIALNKMRDMLDEKQKAELPVHGEMVGHSLLEIGTGILVGALWAWLIWVLP